MQTSRFQLGLMATLALGLGFSLSSSQAIGYPAGAAVSAGANPVLAVGGVVSSGTNDLFTAPSDQDVVVTDVWFTMTNHSCSSQLQFTTSGGDTVGTVKMYSYFFPALYEATNSHRSESIQHSFGSGLPLPAGQTLRISESGGCTVAYTISGYYAQP